MNNKFTFFYGGVFSQWYMIDFVIDDVLYNCTEQYMMIKKAVHFGDRETCEKLKLTTTPKEQKALGRTVKNFNVEEWNKVARDYVYEANYAKFSQHLHLKKLLYDTEGTTLVEASPYDKIWGIGLGEGNPLIHDPANWKGTNWLGEVLTNVRDDLLNE